MFYCDKCGECRCHLDNSELYGKLDRGDGVCIYLDHNLCSIYDHRPLLCRVDESYEVYFKDRMLKDEYYRMNYEGCKNLKIKLQKTRGQN